MRTPRFPEPAALAALAFLLAGAAGGAGPAAREAAGWQGLLGGDRAHVSVGQRALVVLRAPSLAERVARAGGQAGETQMREWTAAAFAAQKQVIARLARDGVVVAPEYSYTRVLNGFSAPLDERGLARVERDPDVAGVYPVRVAYPAAIRTSALSREALAAGRAQAPDVRLPGMTGRGVTVALLDTGVDRSHPYLRGRLADGIDVVAPEGAAVARAHPDDPSRVERHGTEMAGILVGFGGPDGLRGVAPGATLIPIRVAGWQPDASGDFAVYGRTDQLVAGLERAVDPNDDGDAHDAARVAVVGVAEPFAAFPDGPVARAIRGATQLDTLVVVPAGNDGPAGPGYGSIAGPGGAPDALTVAAADRRPRADRVRVVVRAGLRVLLDAPLPLGGAVAPERSLTLSLAAPRSAVAPRPGARALALERFFDARGFSLVAGRAALLHAQGGLLDAQREAAQAGAEAVVVDRLLPSGALGFDDAVPVPVVGLPAGVARDVRAALARGVEVTISIGAAAGEPSPAGGRIAAFSSRGLAFGPGLKPDVAASGVAVATAVPGRNGDGAWRFGSLTGSSAAAALAGGAAALLAQARPGLDASALRGLLAGTAAAMPGEPLAAQGAGLLDLGAAVAAEVVAVPGAVAFGPPTGPGWEQTRTLALRNVSTRPLDVAVAAAVEGVAGVTVDARPARVRLRRGATASVRLTARVAFPPKRRGVAAGRARLLPGGGATVYVPWAVVLIPAGAKLLDDVRLSHAVFRPSDRAPAVLSLVAGDLSAQGGRPQVRALSRLDVELWRGGERLGVLARLRDVLPGRYAFGVTGRGPGGKLLPAGPYRLRVLAVPDDGADPDAASVNFRIR